MDESTGKTEVKEFPPASDLWQIPGIAAAVVTFLVAAYIARSPLEPPPSEPADFEALVMAYEAGEALAAAESARRYLARHPGADNEPLARFIFAASKWDLIKSDPAAITKDLTLCLESFNRALALGIPAEYEARALRAKGDILMRMELPNDALDAYTALADGFPDCHEAVLMMAEALMRTRPPSLDRAEALINAYLETENLDYREIQAAYLALARLATTRGDHAEAARSARRVLDAGPNGEVVAQARLILARALARQGKHAEALEVLSESIGPEAGRFEGALVLERARALWALDRHDEARKVLDDAIFRFPGTQEALGARYLLASVLHDAGKIEAARDAIISLLDDMSAQGSVQSAWFDIDDVARLWFAVGREILQKQGSPAVHEYHAAALALMAEGRLLFFDATLYLREAEQLEQSLPGLPLPKVIETQEQIRRAYSRAGRIFAKVTETSSGDIYRRALFNAGHCFFEAGEYSAALVYLERFVAVGERARDAAEALYEMAVSQAELGDCLRAVGTCARNAAENPKNIYAYRSILLQGDLYRASGGPYLHDAAAVYEGILTDSRFDVESREWRMACFSLGETLYQLGRWEEALLRLEEAISRFPNDPRAQRARYYLGLSLRQAGLASPETKRDFLLRAAETFGEIASDDSLADPARTREAAFLEADCYYDLGSYERAVSLYDRAAQAHVDTPDATRALFQMANCYWHMGREDEAGATYRRALFNLQRQKEPVEPGDEYYRALARWRGGDSA